MPKELYDADWRYLPDATAINDEAYVFAKKLIDEYVAKGYNPRHIAHLIIGATMDAELNRVMQGDAEDQ